jgi:putative nucleotidyltransferase with HDIG domain
MTPEQLEVFKEWFVEYVRSFYTADDDFLNQNIRLKECHTFRVCKEMHQLAEALEMNAADAVLAEAIALFHDVGRFPQFQQYRTYKDTISTNHCLLALKMLREHQVLAHVSQEERAIIEIAVEFHGVKDLPELDERTGHFAKMIRDVDKIDIFELLVTNYRILAETPEKFTWELEYPDTPDCNPVIIEAILNNRKISYEQLQSVNDAKLLQIGWVFDVYFDHSLKQIYDRGYLQAIIDLLPQTEAVRQVTDHILRYTCERIGRPHAG